MNATTEEVTTLAVGVVTLYTAIEKAEDLTPSATRQILVEKLFQCIGELRAAMLSPDARERVEIEAEFYLQFARDEARKMN